MKKFLALIIVSANLTISQQFEFYPARFDYDMGYSPWGIVSEDFNNDGKPDIVTSNKDGRSITIRLGKGNGYFGDTLNFNVGILPVSITSGDFNNDNNPDLATANQLSDNISVLLGKGDGTFADSVNYPSGTTPRYIINYDFNNDDITDIAVANRDAKAVSVFLGNGDGTFYLNGSFSTGNDLMPRMIAAGDFNEDNKPDIAFIHAYPSPNPAQPGMLGGILQGDGNGNFNLAGILNLNVYGTFPEAPAVLSADFNNDNKEDLAITISAGDQDNDYCIILLGSGSFTFNELDAFNVYKKPFSFIAGNFDDDNIPDLAVTNSGSNNVSFHKGNGDGTFSEVVYKTTAQYPRCICAGDFNDDGFVDFAAGDEGGNCFSLLTAQNYFEFVSAPVFDVGEPPQAFPYWGASTDLNNDDNKDLVIANWGYPNQNSTISVLLGNGDNTFQPKVNYDVGIAPKFVVAEDFNKDQNVDIAVNNDRSHTISVLLGNGDGTLDQAVDYPVGMNPLMICASNFNEDSNIDIAAPDYNSDNISILYGTGDGTFSPAVYIPTDDGPFALISTDLNNDDHADFCLANSEYNPDVQAYVSVYLGDGQGSFTKVNKLFIGNDQPWMLTAGDLNGDDFVDLICVLSGTNLVYFLYGDGAGNFTIEPSEFLSSPRQTIIKDFNNDGNNDIAVTSNYNSNIRFLLGDGEGVFKKYPISFGVEGGSWGIIADNFNGDNFADLAVTTGIFGADHISLLHNSSTITRLKNTGKRSINFYLSDNYPNPFNPSTRINFRLPEKSDVTINVFNILGERVATVVSNTFEAGYQSVRFNASGLPSGVYIYRIEAKGRSRTFVSSKKMLLLK